MKPSTKLIHEAKPIDAGRTKALTTPIYETTTFVFESAADVERYQRGEIDAYLYSRYENPTVVAVEQKLAALDGAEASLLFGSGMAAIATALIGLLTAGDEVLCGAGIYGGTFHLIEDVLAKLGVARRFLSAEELAAPDRLFGPKTRLLWFESPNNPHLRCADIAALAAACHRAGVIAAVDNTFACPLNQPVLSMGVDLSFQSATKYLNGHSDVTGGLLSGSRRVIEPLSRVRRLLGGTLDPTPAYALGRALKTLPLRIAQHNATAQAVAQFLEGHPAVARVYYPGLPSHPDYAIARKQMRGFGGMVTIDLKGGRDAAYCAFDKLKVINRAASLGSVESLCSLPVLTSQYGMNDEELAKAGVTPGMMRFSIGLEDVDDLVADLAQALSA
jgi:cystathionine beta-lyase/cystathionine gamma-synthase